MIPTITIGNLQFDSYLLFIIIASMSGFVFYFSGLTETKKEKNITHAYVLFFAAAFITGAVFIPKIFGIHGASFSAGIFLAVLVSIPAVKKYSTDLFHASDSSVAAAALGLSIAKIGCLFKGCCYGIPADPQKTFTIFYPQTSAAFEKFSGAPLLPSQIYQSLAFFIIFIVLIKFTKTIPYYKTAVFLILSCVLNSLILFTRPVSGAELWLFLTLNLITCLSAVIMLIIGKHLKPKI
ncbi:MAG: prolipoprotein diacylglyceryl transferase [Candidatus Goldbacteria bacterium]|nr:prolipoprotein diacylglyceryl transferase [Candidatus Goldiibacteriota bacterium]